MPLRLPDLVGRAMIDPEFLTELRRSTDVVLAEFELTEEEGGWSGGPSGASARAHRRSRSTS